MLFHDGFGPRNLRLARFLVLLDDFAEIVNVVEVEVVETVCAGIHVARHAEIDQEYRAAATRLDGALKQVAREHGPRRAHGGDENVRKPEHGLELLPRNRLAAHAPREFGRALIRTVHNAQASDTPIAEMINNLFGNAAGANDQRRTAFEIAEDPLGEFRAAESH